MFSLSKTFKLFRNFPPFSNQGLRMDFSSKSCVDLASLNKPEMKDFIDSFDTVLTDCDGVVWLNGKAIPGAVEVMNAFKDMGKKVFYVTNNSTLTRPEFRDKCTRLGFKATEDDIISTAWLTARYLTNAGFNKRAYIIGSKAIAKELKKVGIESIGVGPDLVNPAKLKSGIVLEELAPSDRDVGAVIVGFDHHFSLPKIVKACTYLADPECLFIGTNTDQTYPHQGNFVWPGTGAFIAAIETGSQRKANIVGKPESFIIDTVLKGSGFDPKRTVMLGDRCNTDIHFGNSGGMLTILVLSGVTSLKELNEYKAQGQTHLLPTFYTNSIADLMPFLGADK